MACLRRRIPYVGVCLTERHRDLLDVNLLDLVLEEFKTEGSRLYEPEYAMLFTPAAAKATTAAAPKGRAKAKKATKAEGKKRTVVTQDDNQEDQGDGKGDGEEADASSGEPVAKSCGRAKRARKADAEGAREKCAQKAVAEGAEEEEDIVDDED
jgi:hypothetical protein